MTWRAIIAGLALVFGLGAAPASEMTLVRGARVFDGSGRDAEVRDVLVRGDRIVSVGRNLRLPRGATLIDASGLTMIPGIHDLHIHTGRSAFLSPEALHQAYRPYLEHGVTSVNEYSVSPEMLADIRAKELPTAAPRLRLAARMGVPHGHGTESDFTDSITAKVTTPAEAHAAMRAVLRSKPDLIKVFADGWRYGRDEDRPDMDLPTLSAIVKDARKAGVPVVTHTVTLAGAKTAARAGVNALVHGIGDAPVDEELIRLMKRSKTAYVPTLAVYEPQQTRAFLPEEWAMLSPDAKAREEGRRSATAQPLRDYEARRWEIMKANARALHDAGIRIGIGTDTGIGGVYPGSAAIREMRLLASLGIEPREVLLAATSGAAAIIGKGREEGRIARGRSADFVLVLGKPDERIEDLYRVWHVFVGGRRVIP